MLRKMLLSFPYLSFLVALASLAILINQAPSHSEKILRKKSITESPPLAELTTNQIEVLSLGYKNVYDDFINIWLLQNLLEEDKSQIAAEDFFKSIMRVVQHKPKLETIYMLSCLVMHQDFARADLCEPIGLLGIDALPNAWRIPVQLGYIHAFHTKNPAKAARFFALASSRDSAPNWLLDVARILLEKEAFSQKELEAILNTMEDFIDESNFKMLIDQIKNGAK